MANGEWQMANGEWQTANGKWRMANGEWQMANGEWRMENFWELYRIPKKGGRRSFDFDFRVIETFFWPSGT